MSVEAHLLSPYRPPTSYPVSLNADEATAWLCGYFALWHPAVLARLSRPPAASSSYDHDQPGEGFVYGVPDGPHLYQPDDWADRVREVKAVAFTAAPDRAETMDNLRRAFRDAGDETPLLDVPAGVVRQFAAVGYGYLLVETLFDAAEHEHLLDAAGFWADVRAAVQALTNGRRAQAGAGEVGRVAAGGGQPVDTDANDQPADAGRSPVQCLRDAAEKLRSAREVLNSNPIRVIDWAILDRDRLEAAWPAGLSAGVPLTVLASGELLERLATDHPERFAELKGKFHPGLEPAADLCCGSYREREDALLPAESQWWNLGKARETVRTLFGVETTVFGRKRSAHHPHLPAWVQHYGYQKAVIVSLDGALTPARNAVVVNWPSPDGKSVDAFGREPQSASDPLTFFNLAHTLHQATTQDSTPTLALAHKGCPPAAGYEELVALANLAPAVGEFTGLARFLADYHYGEHLGTATADDFFADYLDERVTTLRRPEPVSGFAKHLRLRRRLDAALTLAALHRSLTPPAPEDNAVLTQLGELEDEIETRGADTGPVQNLTPQPPFPPREGGPSSPPPLGEGPGVGSGFADELDAKLATAEAGWAKRLADRIQARSAPNQPGLLVFNPFGFARRVALELDTFGGPVPVADPIKAAEFDGPKAKLVVEVPGFGFAWVPRPRPGLTASPPKPRIRTADGTTVRNEFFEAEVDAATGGLRAFRDPRTRLNRVGMQPVFNPGCKTKARSVQVTAAGAALGEVTAEGDILDDHGAVLATFRHRVRAWVGRPALELLFEIEPRHLPTGYPWHAYYGLRFGWRDERAAVFRGVNGTNAQTTYTRPVSPDYLEVRLGPERTFVFTGGLPFVQRHGTRMADVILVPEGEQARRYELLIAADREYPMQTAVGWVAPAPVVWTDRGPPHAGATGWLAHVDLPSLLATGLRPVAAESGRAVAARFIECAGFGGAADLRFARDPVRAAMIDGEGHSLQPVTLADGAIPLEFSAGEAFRVRAEWE